jgi:DNA repair protein RecO (recombination protein O)
MFVHYRTQGLVIRKTDSEEADRIFTFFTKDFGKMKILAKAERKIQSKLRGGLEIFYLVDIGFIQGKTHKTLTDVTLIDNFKNIRKDLVRLKISYRVVEIIGELLKEGEKDENIWRIILETFQRLDSYTLEESDYFPIYYYFLWSLFSVLGYQPEIHRCPLCQKKLEPGELYFSFREGGIVCKTCARKLKPKESLMVNEDFVKVLRIILRRDWQTLERLKIGESVKKMIRDVSERYLSSILEEDK